jgi:RNA polymerase sigma-70 factor (ECF subfamily)
VRTCIDRLTEFGVDALGALFDLTSQRLVRFAVALTQSQHDAEDAVQTALVRIATDPRKIAESVCPWAYLLKMVRNEAWAMARRKRRWESTGHLDDLVTVRRVDEVDHEEMYREVWLAIRGLPAEQAEVVVLKIWEEMTFSEIGRILDTSPNTVASRYQYAMVKLGRKLRRYRPAEEFGELSVARIKDQRESRRGERADL